MNCTYRTDKTKRTVLAALFFGLFLFFAVSSQAMDMGNAPMRDYTVSLSIPKGRFEIGLDLLHMDDNIDIFNTRTESDPEDGQNNLGDLTGFRAYANYGLFDRTAVQSVFIYRDLEYGNNTLGISGGDLWVKQVLSNRKYGNLPYLAADFGLRINSLDDAGDAPFSKMGDYTPFARLTAGIIFRDLFPNIFAEYGYSMIDSELDSDGNNPETIDPNRDENQFRTGLCVLIRFPYTSMLNLEYNYIRVFRKGGSDSGKYNHIVKTDACHFITENLILNLGCTYYNRQFNGVIPFLYNNHTQNDFAQSYLEAHIGLTFLFGGQGSG